MTNNDSREVKPGKLSVHLGAIESIIGTILLFVLLLVLFGGDTLIRVIEAFKGCQ